MTQLLAVAYPELDGLLRASQQPQGVLGGCIHRRCWDWCARTAMERHNIGKTCSSGSMAAANSRVSLELRCVSLLAMMQMERRFQLQSRRYIISRVAKGES
ncbi:hypothetical protein NDU88_003601 [Pleurodeles waltl]|uniref:Uncharacterized protein n=1 Tax=Pleurodeles waltl TaxID=8319 RepID=A0AAV7RGQ0_PLEWA|nr:hypothetical protein NDU88_003601 [Pleurodeles waltl]